MRLVSYWLIGLALLLVGGSALAAQPIAHVNLGALTQLKASAGSMTQPRKPPTPPPEHRVIAPVYRSLPPPLPFPPPRAPALPQPIIHPEPSPVQAVASVAPITLAFTRRSARLSTVAIAAIHQFAAHPLARSARIMIAANAISTAQNPARAYRLAFARGRAVRDRLVQDGIPLTRIIVQSQILPSASLSADHRAILTLIP